jgi:8-oxo-dGTP pyrophosphatase MutT (NUDIX family)
LYRKEEGHSLVLIKRTSSVKSHPGEVSFPGGMFEPTDGDSRTTALRECCEEIGVREKDIEVIGRLDDERTLTGFVITPFVGVIPFPYSFSLSENEVAYLIHLPIEFLAGTEPVIEQVKYDGEIKGIHALYYKGERIWGATCRLLLKLKGMIGE